MLKRSSGILMHISSLNGKYGIGDFGKSAYEFIDFLKLGKQKLWQILPLGTTGYGDSPYQSFSAFAGNPYFIDLDEFVDKKYIDRKDLKKLEELNEEGTVNYEALYIERYVVLRKAYVEFKKSGEVEVLEKFKEKYSSWLPEYALYMSLKNNFGGVSWQEWPREFKLRDKKALKKSRIDLKDDINFYIFLEYFFRKQWMDLKKYANKNNVKIIGDIPIFVSTDSADVWEHPEMFQFDKKLKPKKVAGCPPDAFSEDGQLWGNILYNWKEIKKDNYKWWIDRVRDCFKIYDIVRIDHFRGFDSYWSIPALSKTAKNGRWEKGPGMDLFRAIKNSLGNVDIIAEDLGFLTPRVERLLKDSGYPGMKILQFGFGTDESNGYLPTNVTKNSVIYTGTHDNQTLLTWYKTSRDEEKDFCHTYLANYLNKKVEDVEKDIVKAMMEAMWKSLAVFSIIPMQDLLYLEEEGRMNTPSTLGDNWKWRVKENQLTQDIPKLLAELSQKYKR
ncbi:MAG: 4-alpha-glucanotransferase [Cetobacterium sp.]|uniref:4-alpha-glucanotransferase n=1 Tax=Cetobacterium sp. TaxID=2071632 RepID=UPI003F3995DA